MDLGRLAVEIVVSTVLATLLGTGGIWFVGQEWIRHRFNKQLEVLRHENSREIEQYRHDANAILQRITLVQEKEFEVVSNVWERLQNSLPSLASLVSSFQERPDLDRVSLEQLREFAQRLTWTESDKRALCELPQGRRLDFYRDRKFWYDVQNAWDQRAEFSAYLHRNRIFLAPDVFQQLDDINVSLLALVNAIRLGRQSSEEDFYQRLPRSADGYNAISARVSAVAAAIQQVLHRQEVGPHKAADVHPDTANIPTRSQNVGDVAG